MKLKTILIVTTLLAVMTLGRRAAAEEAAAYPVIAYAAPAERSLLHRQATADRTVYLTEAGLFSSPASTVRTEEGIIVEWRERVFASLSANMTPDVADGGRMVARIAVKESVKLAVERLPRLERLIKVLKLEVSTDMLARDEKDEDGDEALPAAALPERRQSVQQAVKERFFMRTGLRIPVEQGKPALLSETHAVYGSITSFLNLRLDGRHDSSLGLRYTLSPDMQVQLERATAGAADPAPGGTARRYVQNSIKLVCVF